MCDDLISVVVPIFNLAPWLPRCVESILGQTHRNLEVLLVDDGSIDDSLFVAEEFAGRDPRVRVFHQRNAGVTAARMLAFRRPGAVGSASWTETTRSSRTCMPGCWKTPGSMTRIFPTAAISR